MALHLLCKDPESPNNGSPTLYYDDETDSYLLQSWKVDDPARLSSILVPDHETVVEFPARLLSLFPRHEAMPHKTAKKPENIAD
ncbi:hypothetical protein ME763_06185 [Streptomyces murinus]|uniref:hypothetical protein n=1 Tax=Streptomyces murinus TaxID=33900 RepID=UPI000A1F96B7|nr:hypothetical protein [Streptomyces murinus]WDO05270.1 hypothetical protein ME763_06185 [Streptomyces murinus]